MYPSPPRSRKSSAAALFHRSFACVSPVGPVLG